MDAAPRRQTESALDAQRFNLVMRWPGLRGEPKLAWWTLYFVAAQRDCTTIDIHPAAIAAAQGTDARCGVRCLQALERFGLITVIDRKVSWKVFINDPLEAAHVRPGPKSDGQGELSFLQDDQSADEHEIFPADRGANDSPIALAIRPAQPTQAALADVAQHPPSAVVAQQPPNLARAKTSETSERDNLSQTLDFVGLRDFGDLGKESPVDSNLMGPKLGGCGATTAETYSTATRAVTDCGKPVNREPTHLAEALLASIALRGQSAPDRAQSIERLVAKIQQRVADSRLRMHPCLRVAAAIVDGHFDEVQLIRVFTYLDAEDRAGRCRNGRWACFVGVVAKAMREHDRRAR
jgi:hypothetical protein